MAGQRRKAPDLLTNTRGGRGRALTVAPKEGPRIIPRPPAGIGPAARATWRRFFQTWVSDTVIWEADGDALQQWILNVDERNKLREMARIAPLIKGSHGQLMQNPLRRTIRELNKEIQTAREHFGMTALARWRLQLTASEATRSQHELRRSLMRPVPEAEQAGGIIDLDGLE